MSKPSPNRSKLDPDVVFPYLAQYNYRLAGKHFRCSRGKLYALTQANPELFQRYKDEMEKVKKRVTAEPPGETETRRPQKRKFVKGDRAGGLAKAPGKKSLPRGRVHAIAPKKAPTPSEADSAANEERAKEFLAIAQQVTPANETAVGSGLRAVISGFFLAQAKARVISRGWIKFLAGYPLIKIRTAQRYMVLALKIIPKRYFEKSEKADAEGLPTVETLAGDQEILAKVGTKTIRALYKGHGLISGQSIAASSRRSLATTLELLVSKAKLPGLENAVAMVLQAHDQVHGRKGTKG
jgi:hypothetical protein